MKRIVIIGAGYAGVSAAKELERLNPQLTIVLIHRLYYFFHTVGTPRIGSKDSQWASHLVIPLDHLFSQPQNRIITANVTAIYSDRLELDRSVDGDTTMTFDYAILCMGSAYNVPIKIQEHEPEKAISLLHAFHDKIQAAEKVLIVGAGLAGLEFAGEIKSANPEKSVTMVAESNVIAPGNGSDEFRAKLWKKLNQLQVKVILNERVECISDYLVPQTVTTQSGLASDADVVIQATGCIPESKPLLSLGMHHFDESGLIKVNSYLQLPDDPHIFCAGDVSNADTQKLAYFAEIQGQTCAYNISQLIHGRNMKEYHPGESYVAYVPMGPDVGVSQLPLGEMVAGSHMTSMIKGKTLFVPQQWAVLNQQSPF